MKTLEIFKKPEKNRTPKSHSNNTRVGSKKYKRA